MLSSHTTRSQTSKWLLSQVTTASPYPLLCHYQGSSLLIVHIRSYLSFELVFSILKLYSYYILLAISYIREDNSWESNFTLVCSHYEELSPFHYRYSMKQWELLSSQHQGRRSNHVLYSRENSFRPHITIHHIPYHTIYSDRKLQLCIFKRYLLPLGAETTLACYYTYHRSHMVFLLPNSQKPRERERERHWGALIHHLVILGVVHLNCCCQGLIYSFSWKILNLLFPLIFLC